MRREPRLEHIEVRINVWPTVTLIAIILGLCLLANL